MKNQSGVTLISLTIYIIVMTIVLVVMMAIINQFYNNIDGMKADTEELLQTSKFNSYFLREIKKQGNGIDTIEDRYILFKSGNSFSFHNEKLYYNQIVICDNVKDFTVIESEYPNVVRTILNFEHYEKVMDYKIEEIY